MLGLKHVWSLFRHLVSFPKLRLQVRLQCHINKQSQALVLTVQEYRWALQRLQYNSTAGLYSTVHKSVKTEQSSGLKNKFWPTVPQVSSVVHKGGGEKLLMARYH